MPILIDGDSYREAVSAAYEAATLAQVRQIRNPVNLAWCFVAPANGSFFYLYKFDITSTAADDGGGTLKPNNVAYTTAGRWIRNVNSADFAGGGGSTGTYVGSGSPEGATVASPGNTYWDTAGQALWLKNTGSSTNTGWVLVVTL